MKKLNFLAASALLCAFALPGKAAEPAEPVLYGYQGDQDRLADHGLFAFTPTGTGADLLWRDKLAYNSDGSINTTTMLGGWIRNGRLCGYVSYFPIPSLSYYKYVERDIKTGEILLSQNVNTDGESWGNIFLFATYCPTDDRVYGYGFNKSRTKFVFKSAPSTDLDQAVIISVCNEYKDMCRSICFNEEQGVLVGINGRYEMVQIDVNTGEQTLLYTPSLNPAPDYDIVSGLIWLPSRQGYAWNFYTFGESDSGEVVSQLKLIDPANRTTSTLRSFPSTYNFNYIIADNNDPVPVQNAPEACTSLTANFADGATSGNFSFTLPAKLVDGSAISGSVDYTLYVDNKATLSGSGAAGAAVTTSNATLSDGTHYVRVLPKVGGKEGLGELISVFIGEDTPMAPVNVVLTDKRLTWDPVTKGLHGGALDGVEYEVYFGTRLVDVTSETYMDVEDIIDNSGTMEAYQAEVRAKCGTKTSKGTLSNSYIAGESLTVPFTIEPTREQYLTSIQEDTDGNNEMWSFDVRDYDDHNVLTSGFAKDMQSEDWLFLPRFKAEANTIYTLSFNVNTADTDMLGGTVEVWIGENPSSEDMKLCIIPAIAINDYSPQRLTASFMIPADMAGADHYYLGLGVKSEQGILSPLQFETIKVVKTSDNMNAPAAISNLKISTVADSPLKADISFVMPDCTLAGNSIPATYSVKADITTSNGLSKSVTGAPGENVSLQMEIGQGDFLVTVTPTVNNLQGMPANGVAHLGFGLPGAVRNLRAEYNESNTYMTLRWDAPATDMEGTPSEDDILTYNVWMYDNDEDAYVLQVTVPYPLTYATMDMSGTTTLTDLNVAIQAVNLTGASPLLEKILCQVGTPYELPMEEDFNGDSFKYMPMSQYTGEGYKDVTFKWGATTSLSGDLPAQMVTADVGDVIAAIPSKVGAKSRFLFPKFSSMAYEYTCCKFILWTGEDAANITVGATAYPMTEEKIIYTVPKGDGYTTVNVQLPEDMCQNPWVALTLNADYPTLSSRFILAGFSFGNGAGVGEVADTYYGTIIGGEGCIGICGYDGLTAEVFTLDGRRVASQKLSGDYTRLSIAPGIYVVKVGAGRTAKVVVR